MLCIVLMAGLLVPQGWAAWQWQRAQQELAAWRPWNAREALQVCLRLWPWSRLSSVHLLYAQAARQQDDCETARQHLHRAQALRGGADDLTALHWALLEASAGNVFETEDYLQKQADRWPEWRPLIWEALAVGYLRLSRLPDAMSVLEHWLKREPDQVRALELRGQTYIAGQGVSRGVEDLKRVLELAPDREHTRWKLAEALIALSSYEAAAGHLEILRQRWPDDPTLLAHLARCYNMLGRTAEARQLLEEALHRQPNHPLCLRTKAQLALSQAEGPDAATAVAALREVVRQRHTDYLAQQLLFQALQLTGDTEAAKQQLAVVEALRERQARLSELQTRRLPQQPLNPALHYEMAVLLLQNGQEDAAENWLKTAISLDPHYREAHATLAQLYERRGDLIRADLHRQLLHQGGR
ncbi:MAG: tetratricopeptide repeat protein [Thermogemmata sp.]|nr:tetratricopeptide repeat protein [Thermogemmata sp.]